MSLAFSMVYLNCLINHRLLFHIFCSTNHFKFYFAVRAAVNIILDSHMRLSLHVPNAILNNFFVFTHDIFPRKCKSDKAILRKNAIRRFKCKSNKMQKVAIDLHYSNNSEAVQWSD